MQSASGGGPRSPVNSATDLASTFRFPSSLIRRMPVQDEKADGNTKGRNAWYRKSTGPGEQEHSAYNGHFEFTCYHASREILNSN